MRVIEKKQSVKKIISPKPGVMTFWLISRYPVRKISKSISSRPNKYFLKIPG
jgi:hypothetical protein